MTTSAKKELAARIFKAAHLTGNFTLRSGAVSFEYFDKYQFESDPQLLRDICTQLVPLLPDADFLAGIEMGGIPIATVLSQLTGQPTLFVRKTAKTYGTAKLAEGQNFDGSTVLLVEDIVTSGGQINLSADELRALGAKITHAVCVVDRNSGGAGKLLENGIQLVSLFTSDQLR